MPAAINTLAPGSMADPSNEKSKLSVLADVIHSLADADHATWASLADTTSVSAAGRGGPNSSEANRKSIAGHVNSAAKAAVTEMFNATNTDLGEDFKERCAQIFLEILEARVNVERIALQESGRMHMLSASSGHSGASA
jgi:hypothetical protein